jgi:hypothetical protein
MPPVTPAPVELGARFRTIQSQAPSIPFDAGNTRSVELPRSFPYKYIVTRLRGSIASAAGTSGPINENPIGLIKRLDLIADGRKLLMSLSGVDAYRLSNQFQGKAGEILQGPTGASTTSIFGTLLLHNEAARMLSPIMSYFDPRPYEKVELRCQWGTINDLYTTPSTATVGAETALDLQLFQSAEGNEQIGFNRLMTFDEFTFGAGASTNFTINVPRSGLLAGILLRTYSANVPTNAFFQNATATTTNIAGAISLKSDNNFLHLDNLNPSTLQARNVVEYALDNVGGVSTAGQTSNLGAGIPGYYYIDLSEDGLITSLLNTFDLNVLQLIVTNQGASAPATTLRVTYIFYEPITAA